MELLWNLIMLLSLVECRSGKTSKHALFFLVVSWNLGLLIFNFCVSVLKFRRDTKWKSKTVHSSKRPKPFTSNIKTFKFF